MTADRWFVAHPRTAAWVGIGVFVACVAVTAMEGAGT